MLRTYLSPSILFTDAADYFEISPSDTSFAEEFQGTSAEGTVTQCATVRIREDSLVESPEEFRVMLSVLTNDSNLMNAIILSPSVAVITILDSGIGGGKSNN